MLFWICQQIVLSIILIISLHYSYLFFKNNLTIPKTIDMIKKPVGQYKDIYNSINKNKEKNEMMKTELKNYLKNLSTKKTKNIENPIKQIKEAGDVFDNNFSTF
tara:strand:- start:7452 stop:7763 length:312 start_codon:yes stop_codon:yes gene_type:complete